tara:strand:- start:490 stop:657 length:168 start_codon:yes stop_codon:yes gene_type:complete
MEDLEDELDALTVTVFKELRRYESGHDTVFVFEGKPYREMLGLDAEMAVHSVNLT